jgi:hypothetical protein
MPTILFPAALAEIASGRDHINTAEFAKATNRASQTIRKNFCLTGECFGIRPLKFGNRLLWPVAEIAELLTGHLTSLTGQMTSTDNGGQCHGSK